MCIAPPARLTWQRISGDTRRPREDATEAVPRSVVPAAGGSAWCSGHGQPPVVASGPVWSGGAATPADEAFVIAESTDLPDDAERVLCLNRGRPFIRVAFVSPLADESPYATIFIATDVPDEATGC
jgi:hypothetical protein